MNLVKFEIKKIIKTPITIIALAAVLALNVSTLLFGNQWDVYKAGQSPFATNIEQLQENGSYFAGEITPEWYQKHKNDHELIISNPNNQVSESEKQKIREDYYARGYSKEAVEEFGDFIYLKQDVLMSNEYNKYEPVEVASTYYTMAQKLGEKFATEFRKTYPGKKGEVFAEKTETMYGDLVENYKAYYNYDYGYWKLRNIHSTYPFTIGLFILIALAPIFSAEYSRKMDSLILSSKHGKKKLIAAKIVAGLIITIGIWILIETINTLIVFGIYGTTGAEAYWQNFMLDFSPFKFNQLQITLVTIATSLLGTLLLGCLMLLISVCSKNQFISLLIGGIVLLAPRFDFAFMDSSVMQTIYNFMPTRMITAINEWQTFNLFYLFGNAIPAQYVILTVAVIISAVAILASNMIFKRKQVEN